MEGEWENEPEEGGMADMGTWPHGQLALPLLWVFATLWIECSRWINGQYPATGEVHNKACRAHSPGSGLLVGVSNPDILTRCGGTVTIIKLPRGGD